MAKKHIIIPESMFEAKWGRIVYPWKLRKEKKAYTFGDFDATYDLTINKKIKTLNFGDDFWNLTGINTSLNLSIPNAELTNIDIKSSTNHPFEFGGYDFVRITNWKINANQLILSIWPYGQEGKGPYNKWNLTSSYLENLDLSATSLRLSLSRQNSIGNIKISSPNKKLEILNLTIDRCSALNLIDLSEIEEIPLRGIDKFYKVDENVSFKFNPNLKIGLSTLHRWANCDGFTPFKYSLENLNDSFKDLSESGKIIALKDIYPEINSNPIISVKDLSEKIKSYLINNIYQTDHMCTMERELRNNKEYTSLLNKDNLEKYNNWLIDEKKKQELEEIERVKQRQKWEEEEKKLQEQKKIEEEKKRIEAEKEFNKKVKEFNKKVVTLPKIQQAYLLALFDIDKNGWDLPDAPLSLINDEKKLVGLKTKEEIANHVKQHFDSIVQKEIDFWKGNMSREDGCIGACEAGCERMKKRLFEKFEENLKKLNNEKVRS